MKSGTIALVIHHDGKSTSLIDTLSDDQEITVFESALRQGEGDALKTVYDYRAKQAKEDEDFGNYVEELLSQPFVRPEIQEHGVQWLKSKIRIEQFQKCEVEAARIIAEYAFSLYKTDPQKVDFFLAAPNTKVRIRIFLIQGNQSAVQSPNFAA